MKGRSSVAAAPDVLDAEKALRRFRLDDEEKDHRATRMRRPPRRIREGGQALGRVVDHDKEFPLVPLVAGPPWQHHAGTLPLAGGSGKAYALTPAPSSSGKRSATRESRCPISGHLAQG